MKHRGSKEIKLIDFGLAKVIEPGKEIREMMGTPEFAGKCFCQCKCLSLMYLAVDLED